MKTIFPLSESLILKIAAGEVIERPVYAVKELLENAIDAAADIITITLEDSGLKKIIVSDNGIGISREDIQEAVKPHTTSKLLSEDSLLQIKTMGFRGEALASISAVSNMSIKSRRNEDVAGTIIEMRAGEFESLSPIGVPAGTTVTVSNLFHPVPARKKFLKSKSTEYRLILDLVSQYSLSFPHIRFTLTHNGRLIFDYPKTTDSSLRMKHIFGQGVAPYMIPVSYTDSYLNITGFISTPQVTTVSSQKQYVFINNRLISDRLITLSVKEAYGNMLPQQANPFSLLFFTLPYETVDVNVHPRKEQISFFNNQTIYTSVREAIHKTLAEHNLTFHAVPWNKDIAQTPSSNQKITLSVAGKQLKQTASTWNIQQLGSITALSDIAQFHAMYLITQSSTGIVLIDQHAAHERILYGAFKKEFLTEVNKKETFILPESVKFTVTPSENIQLQELVPLLTSWGFEIEEFGENTYTIFSVPAFFKDRDYRALLQEVITTAISTEEVKSIDTLSNKMLTYLACRAAIKAGDMISVKQRKNLLIELEKTDNNATCPHGRPTRIELALHDIHKLFKRV